MRVAIYARVSTDEQAREGFSIPAQLRMLEAWATIKGATDISTYVDDGYSGKNLNRPQMQRMLEQCRNHAHDAVLVWRLDRLSRSLRDTVVMVEDIFSTNGITLISSTENIDTSTPSGRLMLNILASFAQSEREATVERVRSVTMDMARGGIHMGGVPPYGYRVNANRHYEIEENEAPAIRMLFALYATGYGYGAIIDRLAEKGYCTRSGQPFTKAALHDMLINEKYTGVYIYNRAAAAQRDGKRNNHQKKPEDEIIRIPGGMPAIISEETFKQVKERMKMNQRHGATHRAKVDYMLAGLVYCGKCGKHMWIKYVGKNRNGTVQRSYACNDNCVKRIRVEKIDAAVRDYILQISDDETMLLRAAAIADEYAQADRADCSSELPGLKAEVESINAKLASMVEFISTAGAAAPSTLAQEMLALEDKRADLLAQIELAEAPAPAKIDTDEILERVRLLRAALESGTDSEKKWAAAQLIRRVIAYDDRIVIQLNVSPKRADNSANGGAEGSRTPVRKPGETSISERSLCFNVPSAPRPQTGLAL